VTDVQPPHVWQPDKLRVGIDASYPPFAEIIDGEFRGHDVELARRLARRLGLELELVNIPFDGLYDALRASRIDVIISALPYEPERVGTVIYSRPYFQAGEVLLVPRTSRIASLADLRGRAVGVELGSLGDQTARRLLAEGERFDLRSRYISLEAAVAALRAGEIAAVVVDRVSALTLVGGSSDLRLVEPPLSDVGYVIATPFDDPVFAERVDRWLALLDRDGILADLTAEYLIE
jgi:polar amino acid transport system substrate-binding protein